MNQDALSPTQQHALSQLQALTNGGDVDVAIGVLESVGWDVQVRMQPLVPRVCNAVTYRCELRYKGAATKYRGAFVVVARRTRAGRNDDPGPYTSRHASRAWQSWENDRPTPRWMVFHQSSSPKNERMELRSFSSSK